jgi:hypothetical protein
MPKVNPSGQAGILLVALLVLPIIASADGGYIWKETFLGQAKSGGQQAVILYFDNRETLVLQTEYEGELADFSWLIPTPSPVTADDVREADANIYYWLDDLTAPSFYMLTPSHRGSSYELHSGGCSCSSGGGGGGDRTAAGDADQDHVEVLETILTETYEVNVLNTTEVQDLIDWLDQNDYAHPIGSDAVFENYIQRGWYFLAVRIRPSNPGEVIKQSLAPIQISFKTDEPVLPMMISSLSSEPETEILIHFLSNRRYKTSNVASEEVGYPYIDDAENYKSAYKEWLKESIWDQNGELYFIEYAGWLPYYDCVTVNGYLGDEVINCEDSIFITRFRSYFSPELFSDDIYFEADANDDAYSVTVEIWTYGSLTQSSLYLGSLFFLGFTFIAPKRKLSDSARNAARLSLLLILCLLAF